MPAETLAGERVVNAVFRDADWNFADVRSERQLHPYPARFIPSIPRQALELLDVSGPVLDPFCGSGTTLAEAQRRGVDAYGIDLNPIACLISRVRCEPWEVGDEQLATAHAAALRRHCLAEGGSTDVSDIPRVDHWFDPGAQEALAGARAYVRGINDARWRDRVAAAVSSATVRVSRQESDTRYAAISKNVTRHSATGEIVAALTRFCASLAKTNADMAPADVQVRCGDARDLSHLDDEHFHAAIFSPPYPNAYEYWLYHKYRMYWLGFDPLSVRAAELGARPHYCKPNGATEVDFAAQMLDVLVGVRRVLRPGAPAVIVIGDSVIGGRAVDNGGLIADIGGAAGFRTVVRTDRTIRGASSSFNRSRTRGRRREHILLLRAE